MYQETTEILFFVSLEYLFNKFIMNVLCGCCVNMLVVDSPSHAQLITDL